MKTKFNGILTLLMAFVVHAGFAQQQQTVSGTVTDASGLPLPGVNIVVEDTNRGTQTDYDGNYSISVSQGETLVFTYLGFAQQEIVVGNSTTINATMREDESQLDEVVVTAYGSTTRRRSSQAVTTITAEDIEDRPNASIVQSMQGQIAGLNIATSSGQPGANSTIILRGVGSINGNIEPLFVIDGVPVDEDNFRSLNQNDIRSISVLKDAAATSVYGNRGANGVIVIETKRGAYNQDLQIQYSAQYGISELQDLTIDLMNSREKLEFERTYGVGMGAGMTDAEIDAVSNQANTYWADYFFRKGSTNQHNLSFTSGSENTTNFTSIGYFGQEGTFIASDLQRFSFRNNFTGRTTDEKFTYTANINANFSKSNYNPDEGSRQIYFNPYMSSLQGLPYLSPYDPDGSVTTDGGVAYGDSGALQGAMAPYILLNSAHWNDEIDEEMKIVGNFNADYNFARNFTLGAQVGMDLTTVKTRYNLHPLSLLGPFQTGGTANTEFQGLEDNSYTRDFTFNSLLNLTYANTFEDKHTITVDVFSEYINSHFDGINFRAYGLDTKTLGSGASFISGTTIDANTGGRPYVATIGKTNLETSLFSYFATLDYDYDGRFGFFGSVRRDSSIRFTEDNQWGTFFSVSGRWNLSEEAFMENSDFNLLKLRASYGTAGNDRIQDGYYSGLDLFRNVYTLTGGYNNSNAYATSIWANPYLQWEVTAQANIGIDFGVWANKLQGNIDIYQKKTTDLFQGMPTTAILGNSLLNSNIGSMRNRGVEMAARYTVIDDEDWRLSLNANGSYNKNEILELAGADENGIQRSGGGATALAEGQPIGSFFTVEYAGVNPANGNALFYDIDGNVTEQLDDADRVFSGKQRYPVWSGGFGGELGWKGFSLSTQWVWFADIYRNNLDLADLESNANATGGGFNTAASMANAWQQPGDVTSIPRVNGQWTGVDYINISDRYVHDASYLRLRNLTLGYAFDQEQLASLPFTGVRMFLQGENLMTFSKWQGWDPEGGFATTASSAYPTPKIYTFGLNVNF